MTFKIYLILLCCVVGYLDAVRFRCDYHYKEDVGWFKYHEIPATWDDARSMCYYEGGILVSPTSLEIARHMLTYFDTEVFTGMRAFSKGQFRTVNGIKLDDLPLEWVHGEPDNKHNAEQCISMNYMGKISDVKCDDPRPYICYRANSSVDSNECSTPDSGYHLEKSMNKCYKFHTKPKTFEQADFVCSAEGGHLAIPNSDEEAKIIYQLYTKYPNDKMIGNFYKDRIFLGFYKVGEKTGADWMTIDGKPIEESGFSKFAPGEPSSEGSENCGSMLRSGLLNDTPCDMTGPFVCEKIPNEPPACDNQRRPYKKIETTTDNHQYPTYR